ncbi:MAG: hypothetical protein N2512_02820 [Armatimonadetes bacterium]|nr:hypothetical protein [Armatimonadota bacterium]
MTRRAWQVITLGVCFGLAALATRAQAQEPQAAQGAQAEAAQPAAERPDDFEAKMEEFKAMGVPEKDAFVLALLTMSEETDMAQLLPYLMLMEPDAKGEDILGMMFFMNLFGRGGATSGPVAVTQGDSVLLIIERGKVYKVDTATMKVLGEVGYRPAARTDLSKLMTSEIMRKARARAETESCQSNLKQIAAGVLMYAQDHGDTLPKADWVPALRPYLNNDRLFTCPTRPHQPIGYAFNKALLGASLLKIERPAETIMIFESKLAGESPVGGADDVPIEGVHDGGICAVFVDGHVEWMSVNDARERLKH